MKNFLSFILCLFLSACEGIPVPAHEMSPPSGIYTQLSRNTEFNHNIKLGNIQVAKNAEDRRILIKSKNYAEVLQTALLAAEFASSAYADTSAEYILSATLLELDIPSWEFSMGSSAKARYVLKHACTERVVLDETLTLFAHVPFSLLSTSAERSRWATIKAMQENVTHLIRLLASTTLTPSTL